MILNEISIFTAITDKFKSGYWFTFLLFEFILLQFGVEYLARHFRIKNEARLYTLWLVSMAVVMYGILTNHRVYNVLHFLYPKMPCQILSKLQE